MVRGHANPGEPDPDKLATARAEAVVAWFLKNGFKKGELQAVSRSDKAPIERVGTSGESNNQRVDFEVVPR